MAFAHVTIILVGSALNGVAAVANLLGHDYPKRQADRLHMPRWFVPVAGTLLGAGAVGLLAGLAVPVLGLLAATGLVLYFTGALVAHLRAHDRDLGGWAVYFVTALAVLITQLACAAPA